MGPAKLELVLAHSIFRGDKRASVIPTWASDSGTKLCAISFTFHVVSIADQVQDRSAVIEGLCAPPLRRTSDGVNLYGAFGLPRSGL